MPTADFDKDINLPKEIGKYAKLSEKGEKIKFVIAKTPEYETKHFLGGKDWSLCGRYNADDPEAECVYCDQYQAMVEKSDEEGAKQLRPVTTFYYPILDLDTNKPRIFQFSAKSIHYTIKGYMNEGVDVFSGAWLVERTEEKGNYYKILRLDLKELTKEQKESLEIAKGYSMEKKESNSVKEE